ncbi:MAG: hypothetical protein LBI65_03830 [Candidatus Symbiothrix sp.]|jgi:hypothetical protein|nr:hypothetical protein [Candidatus Symbiothrix sp.]
MMPTANRIISYEKFEALCNLLQRYEGFVEDNGYVWWVPEEIYFISIERNRYEQIPYFLLYSYRRANYGIITKTKYNLHIIPLEDIEKNYPHEYELYAKLVKEKSTPEAEWIKKEYKNDHYIATNDAIQAPKLPLGASTGNYVKSTERKIRDGITGIDEAIGLPLSIYSEFSTGKKIPVIGNFLTAISIINDIEDGKYFSAAGNTIKAFSGWYGIIWDTAAWMYKTDYMQKQLAEGYSQEYKYYESLYHIAERNKDSRKMNKYKEMMRLNHEKFYNCMDNLKIKYYE